MVKISAQSGHFSVLVLKVSKFWLFKPNFRHLDPDSEYGSGSRPKLNADLIGSGSETLIFNSLYCFSCEPYTEKTAFLSNEFQVKYRTLQQNTVICVPILSNYKNFRFLYCR